MCIPFHPFTFTQPLLHRAHSTAPHDQCRLSDLRRTPLPFAATIRQRCCTLHGDGGGLEGSRTSMQGDVSTFMESSGQDANTWQRGKIDD